MLSLSVMSWSRDLPIIWSQHVPTHIISSHDHNTWPMNFILISSHHQYQYLRHHSHVMTTSESLVSHTITTSSYHHGMRCPSSKNLVCASSRGTLEACKENYFKINTSSRFRWWWLDRREVPSIATTGAWLGGSVSIASNKKTTRGATSEVVREDGWPNAAWPDPSRRQRQLQL